MQNLRNDGFNPFFSHIYVEKRVRGLPRTEGILARFPVAQVIEIGHYKDVFCRRRQSYTLQQRAQNLILAAREGTLLYPGAPVCQSFGNEYFYYTSCMMNCIYDCGYCYLKGMYPSANIVIFVNIEDYFTEVRKVLKRHPLYLCVSYDTDLLALESVAGYAAAWSAFAAEQGGRLKIEIRTKCADRHYFENSPPSEAVIYAFTLSPQAAAEAMERHAPSFDARTACAAAALRMGHPVRLCFDPMLYLPGWEQLYRKMLDEVCARLDLSRVVDVSVGSFRIPQDYLKRMRKQDPYSAAAWFPYENEGGVCHYPSGLMRRMEQYLAGLLQEKLPAEKIFLWQPAEPKLPGTI